MQQKPPPLHLLSKMTLTFITHARRGTGVRAVDVEGAPDKCRLLVVPHQEGRNFSALSSPVYETTDEQT